jgi:hypothetical protein
MAIDGKLHGKNVTDAPTNTIACGGVANILTDHDGSSRFLRRQGVTDHQRVGRLISATNKLANLARCDNTLRPWQHGVPLLGRELGATLAAASSENGAASACAHAGTKTVRLGAAAIVGLECALGHGQTPSLHVKGYGLAMSTPGLKTKREDASRSN